MCHSAWTGYRPVKKLLYIVNDDGPVNSEDNKLEVVSGLQSGEFYVSTGVDEDSANNSPLTIDTYTVNLEASTRE